MSNEKEIKEEKEKIKIIREKIKNAEMIGEVIKVYLDNFKCLITIIITILVTLSNLGWITYGALNKSHKVMESIGDLGISGASAEGAALGSAIGAIAPETSSIPSETFDFIKVLVDGGKIGAVALNIGLIILLFYFMKKDKKKKKENVENKNS